MRSIVAIVSMLGAGTAFAEGTGAPAGGGPTSSFVMIGFMFILMYLFMIRPQNKKAKEHRELMGKLKEGDEILTSSGIIGQIKRVSEQFVVITLDEGFDLKLQKNAIAGTMPKGTLKSI
jgi:preprotein translocase subunit YajC